MNALLVLALLAPPADDPKPKEPAKSAPAGFGLTTETEFYWPFFVLTSPDVQKELKLTQPQIKALNDAQADLKKCVEEYPLQAGPRRMQIAKVTKWADETAAAILDRDQQKRHRQILWQVLECYGGPRALTANPEFAKTIGLTADQQKQAKKIEADYQTGWLKLVRANPLVGNGPVPGEEELAKKSDEAA